MEHPQNGWWSSTPHVFLMWTKGLPIALPPTITEAGDQRVLEDSNPSLRDSQTVEFHEHVGQRLKWVCLQIGKPYNRVGFLWFCSSTSPTRNSNQLSALSAPKARQAAAST